MSRTSRFHFRCGGVLAAAALASACSAGATPQERLVSDAPATERSETHDMPSPPWSIQFADGNGNVFRFWRDVGDAPARYEYIPTTPEQSSSGTYSGGAPAAGELSETEAAALWRRVEALQALTGAHTDARAMGTGALTIAFDGSQRRVLIAAGEALDDFAAFLAAHREPGAP